MSDSNPENIPSSGKNPQSLRLEDVSRILTALGRKPLTVEMIQKDIDAGAPVNANGTMNLVHYMAWLARMIADGN
jgi:hypothetical protein